MSGDFLLHYGYRRRREARGLDFFDGSKRHGRGDLWGSRRQRPVLHQTLPPQAQFLWLPAQHFQIFQARRHVVPLAQCGIGLDEGLPGPEMGGVLAEDPFEVRAGKVPPA